MKNRPGRPKMYHTAEAIRDAKRAWAKKWYHLNKAKQPKVLETVEAGENEPKERTMFEKVKEEFQKIFKS